MKGGVLGLAALSLLLAFRAAAADRPFIAAGSEHACPGAAPYLTLLEPGRPAVVLSGASFPDAVAVEVPAGRAQGDVPGYGYLDVEISGAERVWALADPALTDAGSGCVGFEKDRFTWSSDLLTYVRYLARELLGAARDLDPGLRGLHVGDRTVRLEVVRPQRDRAVLEGVEGGMLGYGRSTDAERLFLVTAVLDPAEPTVLVRVLRNRGSAFAPGATERGGALLLRGAGRPVPVDGLEITLLGIDP